MRKKINNGGVQYGMNNIIFEKIEALDYRSNESYKSLRTNLQFSGSEVKVIMITSCIPNEGKSSVSFNLARSFAENGKKVILIDADLRKSVIIGQRRVNAQVKGLSYYLSGQNELKEVVYETNIENLHIIFAGKVPPNPAELLGHERFHQMVTKLREEYDYVIVDTPPLGSVIDSAVIAPNCDGAVLIISSNTVSYRFAQDVKIQLEKTNCPILGAVLNKVPMDKKGYYGRYGSYYGKYYGNYEADKK